MLEYQALQQAILVLQSFEEGKWQAILETSEIKLRLIRLIQLLSQYLWEKQIYSKDIKSPLFPLYATPNYPVYLCQCLSFFIESTKIITNQDYNYFGTFEQSIVKIESEIVMEFFSNLVDGLDHYNSICYSLYHLILCLPSDSKEKEIATLFQRNLCNKMNLHDTTPSNSTGIFPCLFALLFWIKFFQYQYSVPWMEFSQAFVDFYNCNFANHQARIKNPLESGGFYDALQNFKNFLFSENFPSHSIPIDNLSVDYFSLEKFCASYHSLFQAFQEKCDPQTTLCIASSILPNAVDQKAPMLIKSLSGLHITSVCCGDQHIAIVSATGQLYTWGKGDFGRLGHGNEEDVNEPRLVTTLSSVPIQSVSCGFAYTFAISSNHKLYSWGAGGNGRLGHGNETTTFLPMLVRSMSNESVKVVCAGSVHTCILTTEGKVFTCGKAAYVGHGTREDCLIPLPLDRFEGEVVDKISVATGGFHTLVLTKSRKVYSWGHNRVGQLGIPSNTLGMERYDDGGLYLPFPKEVENLPNNIVDVNAGWGHSSLLTENGDVYVCGRNEEGQLGFSDTSTFSLNERGHHFLPVFTLLKEGDLLTRKVWKVGCGGEHSLYFCGDYDLIAVDSHETPTDTNLGRRPSHSFNPNPQNAPGAAAAIGHILENSIPLSIFPIQTDKFVFCFCGLPGRGKTHISRRLAGYLSFFHAFPVKVFNVAEYRQKMCGGLKDAEWFDSHNHEAFKLRNECNKAAVMDMVTFVTNSKNAIAILDSTNATHTRRKFVQTTMHLAGAKVMFIEVNNDDEAFLAAHYRDTVHYSVDYVGKPNELSEADYRKKIEKYKKQFEPIDCGDYATIEHQWSYMKCNHAKKHFVIHNVKGQLAQHVVNFIMNLRTDSHAFYLTRHGQSEYNDLGRIGGDSGLTQHGLNYAKELAKFVETTVTKDADGHEIPARLWTSTMRRTKETAQFIRQNILILQSEEDPTLNYEWVQMRPRVWYHLDEIYAGACDGMTYEEIKEQFPEEWKLRSHDKVAYRYPRGESYLDVIARLEPIIIEMERHQEPLLIIAHQAILRIIYAFYMGLSRADAPFVKIPLNTVIELIPGPVTCQQKVHVLYHPKEELATDGQDEPLKNVDDPPSH